MASKEDDATLPADASEPRTTASGPIAVAGAPADDVPGYELGPVIGRGGMGEVVVARDADIDRDVALKRMLGDEPSPDAIARFLREAKIQARLDHPAIVPVHELGRDAAGRPYFTMKRLAGTTLAARLAEGAPVQPLLRALVDVCLAIELAHSKRIVHRDLKPSNIMLGDYGEVYVLDWGVARVLDRASTLPGVGPSSSDTGTQVGQLLGTPGYMAPEQALGHDVGPPADVYALGAILFEILTGERLHAGSGAAALASTLDHADHAPAARRPERAIAPELDAACRDALAFDPAARPTARALADRLQRYLDGDRDLARRRELAEAALADARRASTAGDRAAAMRHAGRAVTLDPSCREAIALASALVFAPPAALPPEVERRVADEEDRLIRERSRRAVFAYLAFYLLTPLLPWLTVRSVPLLIATYAAVTVQIAVSFVNWRVRRVPVALFLTTQLALAIAFSQLASPFVLTPLVICGMLLSFAANPWLNEHRGLLVGWILVAALAPFGLELAGAVAPTWEQRPDGLLVHGNVFDTHATIDAMTIVVANVLSTLLVGHYALGVARDRRIAQRRVVVQAWHFEQLLPREPERRAGVTRPQG